MEKPCTRRQNSYFCWFLLPDVRESHSHRTTTFPQTIKTAHCMIIVSKTGHTKSPNKNVKKTRQSLQFRIDIMQFYHTNCTMWYANVIFYNIRIYSAWLTTNNNSQICRIKKINHWMQFHARHFREGHIKRHFTYVQRKFIIYSSFY